MRSFVCSKNWETLLAIGTRDPKMTDEEMNQSVFTVLACRWGSKDTHSYVVGVYADEAQALRIADEHETYRGGKYECEVCKWALGEENDDGKPIMPRETIRAMSGNDG